jgi:hypothetical protein
MGGVLLALARLAVHQLDEVHEGEGELLMLTSIWNSFASGRFRWVSMELAASVRTFSDSVVIRSYWVLMAFW